MPCKVQDIILEEDVYTVDTTEVQELVVFISILTASEETEQQVVMCLRKFFLKEDFKRLFFPLPSFSFILRENTLKKKEQLLYKSNRHSVCEPIGLSLSCSLLMFNSLCQKFFELVLLCLQFSPFLLTVSSSFKYPQTTLIQMPLIISWKACFPTFYCFQISQQ